MKLQNMTVIFIIIMIPIIIVTSYYIGLQIKTITMQKDYTVKLQTAAKDSIQALEINTVEWNSSSSNLADSKRRDVLAAINTFTTSLANSMGIGGAGKGRIQTYIPAIAYTMYDGYYIYSASKVDTQVTDKNGLTQFNYNGTIKANGESYQYILKPYSPYSARYVNGKTDITVNYTLDNYIKIYGTVGTGTDNYVTKEGYLVVCDGNAGVESVDNNSISGIKYRGATITPEYLKEQVYADGEVNEYPYIYDQYDNKQYWDSEYNNEEGNYFTVNADNQKVYLQKAVEEGDANFSISNTFRKISVPQKDLSGKWSVLKIFQILNPDGGYKFYYEDTRGAYVEFSATDSKVGGVTVEKDKDFSAINYCVESYVFTKWVTNNLKDIKVSDLQSPTGGQYNNVESNKKIFEISNTNNPDPENDDAYATSVLAQHKKDVIINTLEKNLAQAQAQAQEMNPNYEYRLPQLTYDEWEQALSNISIIAYMQGMPIGLKYYNNYTIATSTLNKEYVDPDELYFAGTSDQYYHQRNCNQATGSDYVGYRSIDYVAKSYEKDGTTNYYYPHDKSSNADAELECYYCLVNRSTYELGDEATWFKSDNKPYSSWADSYYNALARERYKQIDEPGTYRPDVSITKTASASTVEYGDDIEYTITIKNNGLVADEVVLKDDLANGKLKFSKFTGNAENYIEKKTNSYKNDYLISKDGVSIKIGAGENIEIKYYAKPRGNLGESIKNTAYVYSYVTQDLEYARTTATTTVEKSVKAEIDEEMESKSIYLVLDISNSMDNYIYKGEGISREVGKGIYPDTVRKFVENIYDNGGEVKGITFFHGSAFSRTVDVLRNSDNGEYYSIWKTLGGTRYVNALESVYGNVSEGDKVVFFSDGNPTVLLWPEIEYDKDKKVWQDIKESADKIKSKGVEIYTAGFGTEKELKGLQEVVASADKAFYANNIEELFKNIFNELFEDRLSGIEENYISSNGKIKLEYINRIENIKINGEELQDFKSYIKLDKETDEANIKGTLDLTSLEDKYLREEIVIIYK